jgi:ferredoxin-type protein NapH
MTVRHWLRRSLVGIAGMVGLAYPACAAICPKGRGFCPYPGRCFLYTDVDANSVCDYTTRSAASTTPKVTTTATPAVTSTPTPPVTGAPTPATPAAIPAPTSSNITSLPARPDTGLLQGIIPGILQTGIISFSLLCALIFLAFRSGLFGARIRKTGPALAASAFFALGISLMVTFLLAGVETQASAFAMVYLLAGTLLAAYVWKSGSMSRGLAVAAAAMSTAFGFVLVAPLMPVEFIGLVNLATTGQTLTPVVIGLLVGIGLAAIAGRTFCGHLCPVGSVQELAWNVPGRKITIKRTGYLEALRLLVFAGTAFAALSLVSLMEYTGVYDFFSLTLSLGFTVFLGILALSVVVYRPVCRGLCPFGLLFSLPAHFSILRIRRTGACIDCRKCEKACPARVAGRDASKRECYLCARCTGVCPVEGALEYGNRYQG